MWIQTERKFLHIVIYRPRTDSEKNWIALKKAIEKEISKSVNDLNVCDVADFLNSHTAFGQHNTEVCRIKKIYNNKSWNFETFKNKGIEVCPLEKGRVGIYLRGGNKSSIALAMKLLKKEARFVPVKVTDRQPTYTPEDSRNLKGLSTSHG